MAKKPQTEAEWFRAQIEAIFGEGAQSSLARFLAACGDTRSHATLLRSIANAASGLRKLSPEMRALLVVLRKPLGASALIRKAISGPSRKKD